MKLASLVVRGVSALKAADRPAESLVWLDPFYAPGSPFEERVADALGRGPVALPALVERLSVDAAVDAARDGVWPLDVGAEALPALRGEVTQRLRALDGGEISITRPRPTPDSVRKETTIVGYRLPGRALSHRGAAYAIAYTLD